MAKNYTTVMIGGREYPIASDESIEYIRMVAQHVDAKIQEITEHNHGRMSLPVACIFTALNISDELMKTKEQLATALEKLASCEKNLDKTKKRLGEAEAQVLQYADEALRAMTTLEELKNKV